MANLDTREDILAETNRIAQGQPGGVLATIHADDATPYVTYVLFALRANGEVLFGSGAAPQHTRNIAATPEVSFLIDNREVIGQDWQEFDRIVIEGRADIVSDSEAEHSDLLQELATKSELAGQFARIHLYRIKPRRIILRKGLRGVTHIVDFEDLDEGSPAN